MSEPDTSAWQLSTAGDSVHKPSCKPHPNTAAVSPASMPGASTVHFSLKRYRIVAACSVIAERRVAYGRQIGHRNRCSLPLRKFIA